MKQIKIFNRSIQLTPTRIFITTTMFLLIISVVLRLLTPNVPKNPNPNKENVPIISPPSEFVVGDNKIAITVSTDLPKLTKEMPVYEKDSSIDLPTLAQTMASEMGLVASPGRNYVWTTLDKSGILVYSQYINQVVFTKNVKESLTPLNMEKTIEVASNFVLSNLKISNLKPQLSSIRIINYGQEEYYEKDNFTSGSLYIIPFMQSIGDYDLISNNDYADAIEVWVGPEHQIVKAVINDVIPSYKELAVAKTISGEEIISAVEFGQGTIIFLDDASIGVPDVKKVTNIDLKEAKIEYRSYGSTEYIYPYLKFSGRALMEDGKTANIEVIYPIVRTISE